MVNNLNSKSDQGNSGDQNNSGAQNRGTRLQTQHNVDPVDIRGLIQRSLTPLPVDPIPEWVLIREIRIVRDITGDLSISCAVSYGPVNRN